MHKIVVYDSGMGGEMFSDYLEEELPIFEVIRVIDWRHAEELSEKRFRARRIVEESLRPYIGKVDLIILANHYLSIIGLSYLRHKFPKQNFAGFELPKPHTRRRSCILTTSSVSRTFTFRIYLRRLKRTSLTVILDDYPQRIDDDIIPKSELNTKIVQPSKRLKSTPPEFILACAHFSSLKKPLRELYEQNIAITDSYHIACKTICKILKIRGYSSK